MLFVLFAWCMMCHAYTRSWSCGLVFGHNWCVLDGSLQNTVIWIPNRIPQFRSLTEFCNWDPLKNTAIFTKIFSLSHFRPCWIYKSPSIYFKFYHSVIKEWNVYFCIWYVLKKTLDMCLRARKSFCGGGAGEFFNPNLMIIYICIWKIC